MASNAMESYMNRSGPRIGVLFAFVFATCALSLHPRIGWTTSAPPITVYVDGEKVAFPDQKPIMLQSRVLVPLRGVFEMLDAGVDWDPGQRLVTARKADRRVELHIYKDTARIDNVPYQMDIPAQLIGGRAMVPLRFLSQALGAQVEWIPEEYAVEISTGDFPPRETDSLLRQGGAKGRANTTTMEVLR